MEILPVTAFYTEVSRYMQGVDPRWEEDNWQESLDGERDMMLAALGAAGGRSVLDASCGSGRQAIALAALGWRVTGTDVMESAIQAARRHAAQAGVDAAFQVADMRDLPGAFSASFDCAISCMALDNILDDDGIRRALQRMLAVLRPGGQCYIRLRDFDNLMSVRPSYEVKEERLVPDGRVIRLENWVYESDSLVVDTYIFLHEDTRKSGYRWQTDMFAYRRRALRKAELVDRLRAAGFVGITLLPQPSPWHPYEVLASKGG